MPKYATRFPQDRGSKNRFRELPPLAGMEPAILPSESRRAIYHATGVSTTDDTYKRSDHTEMAMATTNVSQCSVIPDRLINYREDLDATTP